MRPQQAAAVAIRRSAMRTGSGAGSAGLKFRVGSDKGRDLEPVAYHTSGRWLSWPVSALHFGQRQCKPNASLHHRRLLTPLVGSPGQVLWRFTMCHTVCPLHHRDGIEGRRFPLFEVEAQSRRRVHVQEQLRPGENTFKLQAQLGAARKEGRHARPARSDSGIG